MPVIGQKLLQKMVLRSNTKENYNRTKSSRKQNMAQIKQTCRETGEVTYINTNKTHSPNISDEKNSTSQKPPSSNNQTTKNTNSAVEVIKAIEAHSLKVNKKNSTSQKQLLSNNPTTENTDSEVEVINVEHNNGPTETTAIRSVCIILSFVSFRVLIF